MAITIIENACVFDGFHDELSEGQGLLIEDGIIQEVYSVTKWFPAGTTFTGRNIKDRIF